MLVTLETRSLNSNVSGYTYDIWEYAYPPLLAVLKPLRFAHFSHLWRALENIHGSQNDDCQDSRHEDGKLPQPRPPLQKNRVAAPPNKLGALETSASHLYLWRTSLKGSCAARIRGLSRGTASLVIESESQQHEYLDFWFPPRPSRLFRVYNSKRTLHSPRHNGQIYFRVVVKADRLQSCDV